MQSLYILYHSMYCVAFNAERTCPNETSEWNCFSSANIHTPATIISALQNSLRNVLHSNLLLPDNWKPCPISVYILCGSSRLSLSLGATQIIVLTKAVSIPWFLYKQCAVALNYGLIVSEKVTKIFELHLISFISYHKHVLIISKNKLSMGH